MPALQPIGFITHMTVNGLVCSKWECPEAIRGNEMSYTSGREYYVNAAIEQGWTFWRGRSTYALCPYHLPNPGHKMRQVTRP